MPQGPLCHTDRCLICMACFSGTVPSLAQPPSTLWPCDHPHFTDEKADPREGTGLSTTQMEAEKPGLRYEIDFKVWIQGLRCFLVYPETSNQRNRNAPGLCVARPKTFHLAWRAVLGDRQPSTSAHLTEKNEIQIRAANCSRSPRPRRCSWHFQC